MALRGTLKDFSLAEILQLIGFQRKTGVLTIEGEEDTVSISFSDGRVVGSESVRNPMQKRVGSLLVRAGKLSAERLEAVLQRQRDQRVPVGSLLVREGIVSEPDLEAALRTQILNLIYRVFRWKDGRYHFSALSSLDESTAPTHPIETENILMEAARMSDEWALIQELVPSLDLIFRRAAGTENLRLSSLPDAAAGGALQVSRPEAIVWNLIDGRRTVNEITDSVFLTDFDVVKALADMLRRQLLSRVEAPPEPEEPAAVEEPAGPPPAPAARPGLAFGLWSVLVILAALSLALMPRFPWNVAFHWAAPGGTGDAMLHSVYVARLQRVERGIEVFYLTKGRYPESLRELAGGLSVEGASLSVDSLEQYRYILRRSDGKYDLYGRTRTGALDPSLVLSRSLDPVADRTADPFFRPRRGSKTQSPTRPSTIDVVN